MYAFNVWLGTKQIDTVFYSQLPYRTIEGSLQEVYKSLTGHDGYSPDIRVTWPKGQRVTTTVYELWGDYGSGYELLTADESLKAIRANKLDYLQNAPCPMKIVKKLERK